MPTGSDVWDTVAFSYERRLGIELVPAGAARREALVLACGACFAEQRLREPIGGDDPCLRDILLDHLRQQQRIWIRVFRLGWRFAYGDDQTVGRGSRNPSNDD